MNFKKPTKKSTTDQLMVVGSAGAGAVVSKGLASLMPDSYDARIAKGILLVSGVVLAASTSSKALQGFGAGVSIQQGVELVTSEVKKVVEIDPAATGVKKALQSMLGSGVEQGYTPISAPLNNDAWNALRVAAPINNDVIDISKMSA